MTSKEALNLFKKHFYWKVEGKEKAFEILEQLVDKDTPMKVKNKQHGICPNCEQNFSFMHIKYCFECGQRLDWSENV